MNKLCNLVIERVENGIVVIDSNYKIVFWNKWLEKYSNILMVTVVEKPIMDVVPLFNKSYYKQIFDQALYEGQSMFCSGAIHSVFIHKKGQQLPNSTRQNMRVEPLEFEGKTYVLLQINDITNQHKQVSMLKKEIAERKRIEKTIRDSEEQMKILKDEALQASKAKSEFLAVMSHEIRTPMNAIIGMAELLQETELSKEQREYVSIFQKSGENLLRIINDILDLSKIESGKTQFMKRKIDLPDLIEEMVAIYSFQAKSKGLSFFYQPKNLPRYVLVDSTRLHQIIANVVSNAIKFTEQGSVTLEVDTFPLENNKIQLFCRVIDTGVGIPMEKREAIFEHFTQVDSSTTRKFGGTGLGLAIVKRLAEGMNGQISVEGNGPGSIFTIKLELEHVDEGPKNFSQHIKEVPTLPKVELDKTYRILIAEDSPDNYKLLQAYLKKERMKIDIVENGRDAFRQFIIGQYDLIIMDIEMPEMDGLEATRRIRQWEIQQQLRPVPIVALTAHALGGYDKKSIEAGCSLHLVKPIKKDDFIAGIYHALLKTTN